jgi:hypothetical protein
MTTAIHVTKLIKIDDPTAKEYIGRTVYGMSGYPYGILEEVRIAEDGTQAFWVRNNYGLIEFSYFCLL